MLAHEPAVAYFEHEANNCFNKKVQRKVSNVHADVLQKFCWGTHKVVTAKARECYEEHRAELEKPLALHAGKLAAGAHGDALKWSSLLDNVTEAAGGARPFVMYYEALQLDPKAEIERLFAAVGLGGKGEPVPGPRPVDVRQDHERRPAAERGELRRRRLELDALDPCLAAQFRDADSAVFADLCLPGNRRVPWG
ncbi:hypothetical protein JL720_5234 [Aureococcus anophagefferens]|nr:hypothetical protein JL720_5234 [Aureococcus anophagefferens]